MARALRRAMLAIGVVMLASNVAPSSAAEHVDPKQPVWRITHAPPPQAGSTLRGARVKVSHPAGGKVVDLFRYSAGKVVRRAQASYAGKVVWTSIDNNGTIVAIAEQGDTALSLVWRRGDPVGTWAPFMTDVSTFYYQDFYIVGDDAGDIVVFSGAAGDEQRVVTWDPSTGWGEVRALAGVSDLGRLDRFDVTPDGRIAGLWVTDGADPTATMTWMPVDGTDWTSSSVIAEHIGGAVSRAAFDARNGTTAAFALWTDHGIVLGSIGSAGDVVTTTVADNWTVFYLRADLPNRARFVLVDGDVLHLLQFDGRDWVTTTVARHNPSTNVVAVNRRGAMIFAWDEAVRQGIVRVVRWRAYASPVPVETISHVRAIDVRRAMVLDDGLAWIHCRLGSGRHAFAELDM